LGVEKGGEGGVGVLSTSVGVDCSRMVVGWWSWGVLIVFDVVGGVMGAVGPVWDA